MERTLAMPTIIAVQPFRLVIDFRLPEEDLFGALLLAAHLDRVSGSLKHPHLRLKRAAQGLVVEEVELVSFASCAHTDEVRRVIRGMKPARRPSGLAKLLAFGGHYPELQRESRIPALGDVYEIGMEMDLFVPLLGCDEMRGRYCLFEYEDWTWEKGCRFLVEPGEEQAS